MAEYTSLKKEAKEQVSKFMFNITDAIVKNTERSVKQEFTKFPNPPVDTGTLRRSITGKVLSQNKEQVIGEIRASTVLLISGDKKNGGKKIEYAKFIELGTTKMPARPFMRNGVASAEDLNNKIIKRLSRN